MNKEKISLECFSYYPVIGLFNHSSKDGNLYKEIMGLYNNKNELRTLLLKVHEHSKQSTLLRFFYEIFNIDNYGYDLCLVHLYASWVISSEYSLDNGVSMTNPLITFFYDKFNIFTKSILSVRIPYILYNKKKSLDWPDDIDYIEELDKPHKVSIWSLFNWTAFSYRDEKKLLIQPPQTLISSEIEVQVTDLMKPYINILNQEYTKNTICLKVVNSLYRKQARSSHPDKNDPNSNHAFLALTNAKEQLTKLIEESNDYLSSNEIIEKYKYQSQKEETQNISAYIRSWDKSKNTYIINANKSRKSKTVEVGNKIKTGEISEAEGEKLISEINDQFHSEWMEIEENFNELNQSSKI